MTKISGAFWMGFYQTFYDLRYFIMAFDYFVGLFITATSGQDLQGLFGLLLSATSLVAIIIM